MLEGIDVLYHSSIKINKGKVIYIDPFKIDENYSDADIIFITHNHYDHYSPNDINKVRKEDTIIIAPEDLYEELQNMRFKQENIIAVKPNEKNTIKEVKFETIPAYNINKKFHPKENGWVGYIIEIDGIRYYIAGDTDITEENRNVKCDVAFVPVGGTFTMDYREAAKLINEIKPKIAVPTHYGSIVGDKEDGVRFANLIERDVEVEILMK